MNFLNYTYSPLFPQPILNTSSMNQKNIFQLTHNSLRIPPFPEFLKSPSLNTKRSSPYIPKEAPKDQSAPVKKIKVDSLNMLMKPSFSESDPYQPKNGSTASFSLKENDCSPVCYRKLNEQLLAEKRITIDLSTTKSIISAKTERKAFREVDTNLCAVNSSFDGKKESAKANDWESAGVRRPRENLYNLIYQKLEENCSTLVNQMQGLIALSQDLKKETPKAPLLAQHLEDTQPGTPNTVMSESWYDTKSQTENQGNQEEVFEKSESKKLREKGRPKKKSTRNEKISNSESTQSLFFADTLKKNVESGRKMNRLQLLRYRLELQASEDDMVQKIILTRVGKDYQADVVPFQLDEPEKRTIRRVLKLKRSPEDNIEEQLN